MLAPCLSQLPSAAVASPAISDGVLGIEVAGSDRGRDRLANHDFGGLYGASCGRRYAFRAAPAENNTATKPHSFQADAPQIREIGIRIASVIVASENVVCLESSAMQTSL